MSNIWKASLAKFMFVVKKFKEMEITSFSCGAEWKTWNILRGHFKYVDVRSFIIRIKLSAKINDKNIFTNSCITFILSMLLQT